MSGNKPTPYAFLDPLEPMPRGSTTERVERALKRAIVGLDIRPGEFIDKNAVCKRLGVSRFPVSEALARLNAEGLVEIMPQRGSRAALIRLPDVEEAMLIRRSLEAAVAEAAARRLAPEGVAELRESLAAQKAAIAANDRPLFQRHDWGFHEILVTRLGFARVGAAIEASRANVDRVRRLLSSPRRHVVTLAEHEAIFRSIAARDPAAARRAMEAHLDGVIEELTRFAAAHPEVFVGGPGFSLPLAERADSREARAGRGARSARPAAWGRSRSRSPTNRASRGA
jgi:DNA-binding GntR family transcriptional regulator